jgi:hypothetical protein
LAVTGSNVAPASVPRSALASQPHEAARAGAGAAAVHTAVMSAATTTAARVKRAREPVSDSDTPISFVAISGP